MIDIVGRCDSAGEACGDRSREEEKIIFKREASMGQWFVFVGCMAFQICVDCVGKDCPLLFTLCGLRIRYIQPILNVLISS